MMIKELYEWLYKATARPDERGEYSGGRIQGDIREAALGLCGNFTGKALEVGTGAGLFLAKLASANPGAQIWSVDINEKLVDKAARKMDEKGIRNVHILRQDVRNLSFDPDTFDLAICINFFITVDIEFISGLLRELVRVSKKGARIIFDFRNSRNLLFRLKYKFAGYYDPSAPHPLYTYDPDLFEKICEGMGLEIVNKKHLGFPIKYFAPIIIVEARKR